MSPVHPEDYRLIHLLFLDETALALLLINPQRTIPLRRRGNWLGALETAASQPVDLHLVIRQMEDQLRERTTNEGKIRWMNVTRYLDRLRG